MRPRCRRLYIKSSIALAIALSVPGLPDFAHPGLDEQIAEVTSRLTATPRDAELYLRRAELHRAHRDWAAAQADYVRCRELKPALAIVDLAEGQMLLEAGRPAEARRRVDRFLERSPEHSEALAARARTRAITGDPLGAALDFTRALATGDREHRARIDYFHERARALLAAGAAHRERALAGVDEGLTDLGRPITLELLALEIETALARWDTALSRIDRLAAGAARRESWLLRRAEILELAGRPEPARAAFEATLRAVDELSESRRATRAVQELVAAARAGLTRLDPDKQGS